MCGGSTEPNCSSSCGSSATGSSRLTFKRNWELSSIGQAQRTSADPAAQLALATILQAYTGVSDDEAIEATTMDRRWQLVLDCLDGAAPPLAKRR